ncbi:MAG TPA: dihydrodipicolinate synthase family protein [Candidatus Acidoferrales bacterium]|nr:dihydrodipicolinate synthase family protein [Candidatus Acidoferrales bacterium]
MNQDRGVNAAAITPRGKQGDVDLGAAFELIDYLCASGIRGIVFFSPAGEYPSLSIEERGRLLYLACKRSRVPLLAGIGSASLDASLALARDARDAGAAGLLLPPPYFFRYQQDDLVEFYLQFAARAGKGAVTYISNAPAFSSEIHVETALQLLATGSFAGMEEASGNLESFSRLQAASADGRPFTLLSGMDSALARSRCAGAHGAISPAACAIPELVIALDSAIRSGDARRATRLDVLFQEFLDWLWQFPPPVGLKVATSLRGLKTGPLSMPLTAEKQEQLARFREWFQAWLPTATKLNADA